MDWVNFLLGFVVFLILALFYLIYRNERVYTFASKINHLVFLNNMLQLYKNEGHGRHFDCDKLLPSYDRMVWHIKPVQWFFKPPKDFLLEFSADDIALLLSDECSANVIENVKSALDRIK